MPAESRSSPSSTTSALPRSTRSGSESLRGEALGAARRESPEERIDAACQLAIGIVEANLERFDNRRPGARGRHHNSTLEVPPPDPPSRAADLLALEHLRPRARDFPGANASQPTDEDD